jgi:hypothetical protein
MMGGTRGLTDVWNISYHPIDSRIDVFGYRQFLRTDTSIFSATTATPNDVALLYRYKLYAISYYHSSPFPPLLHNPPKFFFLLSYIALNILFLFSLFQSLSPPLTKPLFLPSWVFFGKTVIIVQCSFETYVR